MELYSVIIRNAFTLKLRLNLYICHVAVAREDSTQFSIFGSCSANHAPLPLNEDCARECWIRVRHNFGQTFFCMEPIGES